jgi:hypothetical protein
MHLADYRAADLKWFRPATASARTDEAGSRNPDVLDLRRPFESTRFEGFREAHRCNISRSAFRTDAGRDGRRLSGSRQIPWIASYAMFNPGRSWEPVRTIAALGGRVKIAGAHAGYRSTRWCNIKRRGYRDYARDSAHDRRRAVRFGDQKAACLSEMWGPGLFALRPREIAVVTTSQTPLNGKAQTFREGGTSRSWLRNFVYNALIAADRSAATASSAASSIITPSKPWMKPPRTRPRAAARS